MNQNDLKNHIDYWKGQIGNYNEGCGCSSCINQIKESMIKGFDEHIKILKQKEEEQKNKEK